MYMSTGSINWSLSDQRASDQHRSRDRVLYRNPYKQPPGEVLTNNCPSILLVSCLICNYRCSKIGSLEISRQSYSLNWKFSYRRILKTNSSATSCYSSSLPKLLMFECINWSPCNNVLVLGGNYKFANLTRVVKEVNHYHKALAVILQGQ